MAGRGFRVLAGACQFGHGASVITTGFIHSQDTPHPKPTNPLYSRNNTKEPPIRQIFCIYAAACELCTSISLPSGWSSSSVFRSFDIDPNRSRLVGVRAFTESRALREPPGLVGTDPFGTSSVEIGDGLTFASSGERRCVHAFAAMPCETASNSQPKPYRRGTVSHRCARLCGMRPGRLTRPTASAAAEHHTPCWRGAVCGGLMHGHNGLWPARA